MFAAAEPNFKNSTSFVRNRHFDVNLMTVGVVDAQFGVLNGTDETVAFQRTVIENSRKNMLLMPNRKIGYKAFIKVCDVNKFDTLTTYWGALEEHVNDILKSEEMMNFSFIVNIILFTINIWYNIIIERS